jgi:hypothetical protein
MPDDLAARRSLQASAAKIVLAQDNWRARTAASLRASQKNRTHFFAPCSRVWFFGALAAGREHDF